MRDAPEAFGSTYEVELAKPIDWSASRLETSAVFAAFQDERLLGMAGLFIQQGLKRQHRGLLWGMFVQRDARQKGAGRALVEAVIEHAGQKVEVLQLGVISDNAAARHLYAALGFVQYGLELKALKVVERHYDEVLMALDLTVASEP